MIRVSINADPTFIILLQIGLKIALFFQSILISYDEPFLCMLMLLEIHLAISIQFFMSPRFLIIVAII